MVLMRDQRQQGGCGLIMTINNVLQIADSSPLVSTSPTNSESLLKQLELSKSLRQIIKKNEKVSK